MSDLIDYALMEAVEAAVIAEAKDETDGRPDGCIIIKGREAAGYVDPEAAASQFVSDIARAALTVAIPLIGGKCAKAAADMDGDGPNYPYDNGAGSVGWDRACGAIEDRIRALTQEQKS